MLWDIKLCASYVWLSMTSAVYWSLKISLIPGDSYCDFVVDKPQNIIEKGHQMLRNWSEDCFYSLKCPQGRSQLHIPTHLKYVPLSTVLANINYMYWTENSQCLSKKVLSCKGRERSVKHILNIKWQYGSSKWTSKMFKISDENYNNWKWAMYVLEQCSVHGFSWIYTQ